MHQNSACLATEHTEPVLNSENLHPSFGASLPNVYTNGGSSLHPCMQTAIDMSAQARTNNVSPSMLLAQNSNIGMMQGTNGGLIKSEAGYAGNSPFMYGADGNALERQPTIVEVPVSSFNGVESNETILDADTSSFGFLGQIPRNFSLSDLTADFSISSDILGSYSKSPFLGTDTDDFLDPHARREDQGDVKRLDTISEGLSYEGFGGD